jgi:hypothetical protein
MPFESRTNQHNPTIHTSSDTLEMSDNNAAHAVKFAHLGVAFAIELGGGTLGQAPTNTPPTLAILAPASGATVPLGTPLQLRASAGDAEDGDLGALVSWSSNRDGALGTGASRTVTLTAGNHTITATVRDSEQAAATKTVSVEVTSGTQTTLFADDFEGAVSWTMAGLWHVATSSTCASPGHSSPVRALYYGRDATCTYNTGARTTGSATSPTISGITSTTTLRFKHYRKVESASGTYDVSSVAVVDGSSVTTIWSQSSRNASQSAWVDSGSISLSAYAGKAIQLRFTFDSKDSYANAYTGWLIDDVIVTR